MTPSEFAAKWKGVQTTERAAAQSHFIDRCRRVDARRRTSSIIGA